MSNFQNFSGDVFDRLPLHSEYLGSVLESGPTRATCVCAGPAKRTPGARHNRVHRTVTVCKAANIGRGVSMMKRLTPVLFLMLALLMVSTAAFADPVAGKAQGAFGGGTPADSATLSLGGGSLKYTG